MGYYDAKDVREAAYGNWIYALESLAPALTPALDKKGRHVPCPVHGGKDGFRVFKDVDLRGGGICNTCGAQTNGISLIMWVNNWDFKTTINALGELLSVEKTEWNPDDNKGSAKNGFNKPQSKAQPKHDGLGVPLAQSISSADDSSSQHEQPNNTLSELSKERKAKYEERERQERERREKAGLRIDKMNHDIWNESLSLTDPAAKPALLYFKNRGINMRTDVVERTDCIRFHPNLVYFEDGKQAGTHPGIVCAVRDNSGDLITVHRTYLSESGGKADVECARKMMPIPIQKYSNLNGASIVLGHPDKGVIGVAEGLETALSAYRGTRIPCWSTVNAGLLKRFTPPEGIHTVLIWSDLDVSMTGQKAADELAERLRSMGLNASVLLPDVAIPEGSNGVDWNDILMTKGTYGFPIIQTCGSSSTDTDLAKAKKSIPRKDPVKPASPMPETEPADNVSSRYVFRADYINTSPGGDDACPFSPPVGFQGGSEEYLNLIMQRRSDICHGQRIEMIVRYACRDTENKVSVTGPYATQAAQILRQLKRKKMDSLVSEK